MTNDDMFGVHVSSLDDFTDEHVQRLKNGMELRPRSALATYRALRLDPDWMRGQRRLRYFCTHGCLLLDVFDTAAGLAVYWPPSKLSPDANAETAPEARVELTSDGERHWKERAELLEMVARRPVPGGGRIVPWVNCDHVLNLPITREEIDSDLTATGRRHQRVVLPRRGA